MSDYFSTGLAVSHVCTNRSTTTLSPDRRGPVRGGHVGAVVLCKQESFVGELLAGLRPWVGPTVSPAIEQGVHGDWVVLKKRPHRKTLYIERPSTTLTRVSFRMLWC